MKKILLIQLLLLSLINSIVAQQLILKRYDVHSGLNNNTVLDIKQSADGELLIATSTGLNLFDGKYFKNFPELNTLPIISLFVSSDSTIFASTVDSFAVINNNNKENIKFYSSKNGFTTDVPFTFFEIPNEKSILIGSSKGIYVLRNNKLQKDAKFSFLDTTRVYKITSDLQGNLYFATSKGLFSLSPTNQFGKPIEEKTYTIYRDKRNHLWARAANGLYTKNGTNFKLVNKKLGAQDRYANIIQVDNNSLILNKGLTLFQYFYNNKVKAIGDTLNQNVQSIINVIFKDKDETIWIGSVNDGFFKLTSLAFTLYDRHAGIKSNPFMILRTSSNELLVGTDGQGLLKFSPKHNRFVDANFSNSVTTVWSIFEDNNKNLWFATNSGVYVKRQNGKVKHFTEKEGIDTDVFAINFFEDSAQNIWITTFGNSFYKFNGKTISRINLTNNKPVFFYKILPDIDYGYWLITREGLLKFDGENLEKYKFQKTLSKFHLFDAVFSKGGNLILATEFNGIVVIDFKRNKVEKGVKKILASDGLANNSVAGLKFDSNGNLWCTTFVGISIIKNVDDIFTNKKLDIITYGKGEPILGNEYNQFSIFLDKDNSMWLGGLNMIIHHKPTHIFPRSHLIKPYVKNVYVNYNEINPLNFKGEKTLSYSLPDEIILPAFYNNISFKLSAIDFANPDYLKYSFKLKPLDKKFSNFTSNDEIHFVQLPAGNYTLEVRAKDQFNIVSPETIQYHFTILIPFYKNPIFIFISILLFVFLLWMFFSYRNRMLRKSNKELMKTLVEKKEVIELNRQLSEDYKALFASAYSPIMIVRRDTLQLIDANDSASKLLDFTREEFLQLDLTQLTQKSDKELFEELQKIRTLDGEYKVFKYDLFNKSKQKIEVEVNFKAIIYKNTPCYIASVRDITAENKIKENLKESEMLYEKSLTMQHNFLAQISHEIRTPLNSISASAELLPQVLKCDLDDDADNLMKTIINSSKRIIRTLDLILRKAQLEQKIYSPIFQETHLCQMINQLHYEFLPEATEKELDFNFSCSKDDITVIADYDSVRTIISNLIENAIKYTNEGNIQINVKEVENNVIVEVVDTGIGINKEYIPYIFQVFSQEDNEVYKRKKDGNGLGLSLSKEYAELNNAKIEIESKKGVGSTFKLIFSVSE